MKILEYTQLSKLTINITPILFLAFNFNNPKKLKKIAAIDGYNQTSVSKSFKKNEGITIL
jgi:hypothetical protein